jgi:hypothetical protein
MYSNSTVLLCTTADQFAFFATAGCNRVSNHDKCVQVLFTTKCKAGHDSVIIIHLHIINVQFPCIIFYML